jgi:hypothetical protein
MAAAIALAESSGDTNSTSKNPDGGTNVGLFQLDTPGGVGHGYSVAQLKNANTNALVAHSAWAADGHTFKKQWETANNGTADKIYQQNVGRPFVGSGGSTDSTTGIPGAIATAGQLTGQASSLISWLTTPAKLGRIALVIVGGVVVIIGLNQVAKPVTAPIMSTGKKVAKVAATAAAV